jgi:2-C-methyl-D-erythritol 2,4-cyclodiphosphate synthase
MRVGFGFDAHLLVENKPLKLGGTHIEFSKGLQGHSDGDVLLHALSDAVLGACAKGDIGMYFRDDNKAIEGIDSREILNFVLHAAFEAGLRMENLDLVIVADQPRFNTMYEQIRRSLSELCGLPLDRISVKAKTTEGTVVNKNAIACFAVVLMSESLDDQHHGEHA